MILINIYIYIYIYIYISGNLKFFSLGYNSVLLFLGLTYLKVHLNELAEESFSVS